MTRLGEMLRIYRAAKNWTLREVGAAIGITAPTLMRIEQGRQMDAATMLKVWTWLLQQPTEE